MGPPPSETPSQTVRRRCAGGRPKSGLQRPSKGQAALFQPQTLCNDRSAGGEGEEGGHTQGGIRGRTVRCAKSRLFSTPGSHGSRGPELCTPDAVLNGSCTLL